jgi:hypothetical protein
MDATNAEIRMILVNNEGKASIELPKSLPTPEEADQMNAQNNGNWTRDCLASTKRKH